MTEIEDETQVAPPEGGAIPSIEGIAIVGTAPSSRQSAPYPDPGCPLNGAIGWETWCIGMDPGKITRGFHRWYEIHDPEWLMDKENNPDWTPDTARHIKWLRDISEKGAHVVLCNPSEIIPKAKVMDRPRIIKEFNLTAQEAHQFLSSSIAWMLADAILLNPPQIGLWGVDMALSEEYSEQRGGCVFFMREARLRGIKIVVPPQSDMFFGKGVYPDYTETPEFKKLVARRREIKHRLGEAQNAAQQAQMAGAQFMGSLQELDWLMRTQIK